MAMLGRIFPDEAQLEKCRSTLCSIRDFWPPEDLERIDGLLSLVDRACTVQDVKQRLDFWTTWMPLEYDAPELMRLFAYPGVMPDTDAPRQVGNFVLSAYRCPGCESPLYKTYEDHSTPQGKLQNFLSASLKKMIIGAVAGVVIACGIWFLAALLPEFSNNSELKKKETRSLDCARDDMNGDDMNGKEADAK